MRQAHHLIDAQANIIVREDADPVRQTLAKHLRAVIEIIGRLDNIQTRHIYPAANRFTLSPGGPRTNVADRDDIDRIINRDEHRLHAAAKAAKDHAQNADTLTQILAHNIRVTVRAISEIKRLPTQNLYDLLRAGHPVHGVSYSRVNGIITMNARELREMPPSRHAAQNTTAAPNNQ